MTSLSKNARVAGLLYILASVVGVVRLMYIPRALFVDGNAAATANNIVAHESLFRFGMVSQLLASALWLFVPLALYRLLKGVDQTLAVLMVILGSLMQVPIFVVNTGERRSCPPVRARRRFPLSLRQAAARRFRPPVP